MSPKEHWPPSKPVRLLQRHPKIIVFDLMGTLLRGRHKHNDAICRVYRSVILRLRGVMHISNSEPVDLRCRRIRSVVQQMRNRFATVFEETPPERAWAYTNVEILLALDPFLFARLPPEERTRYGLEIHRQIQSRLDLWYVDPQVRSMLTFLQNRSVPFILGSNQETDHVEELLRHFDLEKYFPRGAWFCSEQLGTFKPRVEFLTAIVEHIGVSAADMVYVGNSPRNDVPLIRSGCQVVMLDYDGRYMGDVGSIFQQSYFDELRTCQLVVETSVIRVEQTLCASFHGARYE